MSSGRQAGRQDESERVLDGSLTFQITFGCGSFSNSRIKEPPVLVLSAFPESKNHQFWSFGNPRTAGSYSLEENLERGSGSGSLQNLKEPAVLVKELAKEGTVLWPVL
jgi:hypothetical protein